jgi:hypothetical protein
LAEAWLHFVHSQRSIFHAAGKVDCKKVSAFEVTVKLNNQKNYLTAKFEDCFLLQLEPY